MIKYTDALKKVLENTRVMPVEEKLITRCIGQVAAEDIRSPYSLPMTRIGGPDGYAVRAKDIIGVIITYMLSRVYKTTPVVMLVLSGVVVSALFGALVSATKFMADPYSKLPAITFWLMGSLSTVGLKDILWTVPPVAIGVTGLMLVRWRINVLSLGDEEASSLGVNTELLKAVVVFCATLLTASAVCIAGIVGWVGLVIPHIGRMWVGPDHKVLLPVAFVLGAVFLLGIDDIARTVSSAEIPLGILTAVIGAPFFGYLIRKTRGGWS
jgi:iron complex transport system permease protein